MEATPPGPSDGLRITDDSDLRLLARALLAYDIEITRDPSSHGDLVTQKHTKGAIARLTREIIKARGLWEKYQREVDAMGPDANVPLGVRFAGDEAFKREVAVEVDALKRDQEFENRKRALELLKSWRGQDVSAILQDGLGLIEYRGPLDDYKQDGVFTIRGQGLAFQFVVMTPGAPDRYTVSATDNSIGIGPKPGQDGDRLTIARDAFL